MKLKIWADEQGKKHITLDGIEINSIVTSIDVYLRANANPIVELEMLPPIVEVELDADVGIRVEGNRYYLESIKKE